MSDRDSESSAKYFMKIVYQIVELMFLSQQTLAAIRHDTPRLSSGSLAIILPISVGTAGSVIFRTGDFRHAGLIVIVGTAFALLGWLLVALVLHTVHSNLFQVNSSYSDTLAATGMCYGPVMLQMFMFINPISAALWAVSWMWILVIHLVMAKALANRGYIRASIAISLGWGTWIVTQYYLMWSGLHPANWI
tara:strand:+ start:613 stop:1188 length:576 start_codon:yes stop_codon:yes gene_type:complete